MSWFKLDDQAYDHPKFMRAGNEAIGAWCRAGMWSSKHLTDGVVPREIALTIAPAKVWAHLVSVGLLDAHPDGYAIHDYLDWNPSRATVLAERKRKATNMSRYRDVSGPVVDHKTDHKDGH